MPVFLLILLFALYKHSVLVISSFNLQALCNYKADDAETNVGSDPKNAGRNRYRDVLPCK